MSPRGWALLHGRPVVRVDASMHGCRTEFTQGGVNRFEDYQVMPPTQTIELYCVCLQDDKMGERILKSGRAGMKGT